MKNRDSILMHPLAFIALAVVTVSTPLGAQVVGGRVRVFSADTTSVGQIIDLSDEGFVFENDDLRRSFAYGDLDRLEVSGGIRTFGREGAVIGSALGVLLSLEEGGLNAMEGSLIGSLVGLGLGVLSPLGPGEDERSWIVPLLGDEFPYGGRVRVSVDGNELIGRATAMTDEGFEFVQGGMRRSFTYRDIDDLEWSRGMRSRWKTGWGLGLLGAFIAFPTLNGAWGCVASNWEGPSCEEEEKDMAVWLGAGGLLGLGVGTLVWRGESWEPYGLRDDRVGINPFDAPQLLGIGDRVRVTIAGERTIGELVAQRGPDGYEIDIEGSGSVSVTLSEMEQLQRSVGVRTRWRRGLLIGSVVGLATGVAIGDARKDRGDSDINLEEMMQGVPTESPEKAADDGGFPIEVIGAAVGVVAGLGVGSLFEEERWVTLWDPPDRGTDMTFNPVIDLRPGREGRLAAVLGGRIRF